MLARHLAQDAGEKQAGLAVEDAFNRSNLYEDVVKARQGAGPNFSDKVPAAVGRVKRLRKKFP